MPAKPLFDLASLTALEHEPESATRARHANVEWHPASSRRVSHADFVLDPALDTELALSGRMYVFTESYEELSVHVTLIEDGVLTGQDFVVCDRREPTLSPHRLYLARRIAEIADRADTIEPLEVSDGPTYLVGANASYRNFYHWCFQSLPSIALLREVARERGLDYRIVLPPLGAVQRRSLELLGVDPSECVTLGSDRFLSGVPLLYTNAVYGDFAFQPSAKLIELLAPYRQACLEHASADLPRRFYVSRRDAPGRRPLDNETELARALEDRGYRELVMSELSLEDQVSVFAGAESIVAPHGAALVNLMFAPPTARLVEIMPENYPHACFFRLAQVRGMSYAQILSEVAEVNEANVRHKSLLRVDVARVLAALDRPVNERDDRAA